MARVALVTTSYPRYAGDPSGHFVECEAITRAARGDRVVVLAPGFRGGAGRRGAPREMAGRLPGGSAFGWPGALERVRARPTRVGAAALFVSAACVELRRLGPFDEIVAHWIVPSAFPIACCGAGDLEVVVHGSDARLLGRLPRRARVLVVDRLLARGARFRFVSTALRNELARATNHRILERSVVVPCPIDVRGAPSRHDARARFGIGKDETIAVVVGRLVREKRPLEAARMALGRHASRVVVVGDGPLIRAVERLDARVSTVGLKSRADTLAWIAAADFLVSASRDEGSPTAIREARALGVPVVTVPCGDVEDWARADPGIEVVD